MPLTGNADLSTDSVKSRIKTFWRHCFPAPATLRCSVHVENAQGSELRASDNPAWLPVPRVESTVACPLSSHHVTTNAHAATTG